jgi:cyclase
MQTEQVAPNICVCVGDAYRSVSTLLINDDDVLLIDALASSKDAEELRYFIEKELNKNVRLIVSTHYMSDHMAAFKLFPRASIVAHKSYRDTFDSQRSIAQEEADCFVRPTIEISEGIVIRWGRYTLDIFHNPSKAFSMISVDIPEADLLVVGDAILGNTVFLSSAGLPQQFFVALKALKKRSRSLVIPGHLGVYDGRSFENALFYLRSLQKHVKEARRSVRGDKSVLEIPIENCLAPHVEASDFEKEYHQINLSLILKRGLFMPVIRGTYKKRGKY